MSNFLLYIIPVFLGFIIFQFYYWRRLKEDYSPSLLFSSGSYIAFGVILGAALFLVIRNSIPDSIIFKASQVWLWLCILGGYVGLTLSVKFLHIKYYESFEAAGMGLLLWLLPVCLVFGLKSGDIVSLIYFFIIPLLFILFYFLDGKYRGFTWYKSGRVGFSGLVTLSVFFLYKILSFFVLKSGFGIAGRVDLVISAITVFLLVFSLYNLSEDY